jgi:hypothetical protein
MIHEHDSRLPGDSPASIRNMEEEEVHSDEDETYTLWLIKEAQASVEALWDHVI